MKVLMLGWEFPARLSGGLGTACRGMTRALSASGTEILYVRPRGASGPGVEGVTVLESERVPVLSTEAWRGCQAREVLDVPARLDPYQGRSLRAFEAGHDFMGEVARYTRAVGEIARVQDFDVIHAHDWMSFAAGLYAKEISGKPLIAHVHSTELDRAPDNPDPGIMTVERAGLVGCDQIVCVSESARRTLARGYSIEAGSIRVVHNGVETPGSEPLPRGEEAADRVLFLGRVTAQKDPATFLRAAALVHKRLPAVEFVLAGDGDQLPAMVALSRELDIAETLRFAGALNEAEVQRMYAQSSVFVMPSRSEPFGLVALEAMAHGVPVVATRGAGVLETLPSALVVDAGDYRALAESIVALLTRPALRHEVVENGRRAVARASWTSRGRELSGLYEELAS